MKVQDIVPGKTYIGGKNGESRTVTGFGASSDWVCWAPTHKRLPLGAFIDTRCTSRASFAQWAKMEASA